VSPSADDPFAAIRASLTEGDGAAALARVNAVLARSPSAEQAIALRVLGAQAARILADLPLEIAHLEAAEELAAVAVPGALGGARLQLGLAILRRGDAKRAASVLGDALPVLVDDPEALARAKAAHADARARALSEPGAAVRAPIGALERGAKARVYRLLERLHEADADATADELLVQLLDDAIEATRADRGFVLLAEPDGLKVRVAHDARGHEIIHPHLEVSFSIARTAALEGRTIAALRPAEDPRFARSRSARRLKLKAVCAAPLRYRRESLGVIVLDQKSERHGGFDREMELLATELARGAAGIIFRARRHDAERAAHEALVEQYARDAERVRGRFQAEKIVGASPAIARLLRLLERIASRDTRVLIRGESGTGKELVARTIHDNSPRRKKPFVAVNCGALADTVLEAELFGHEAGAFTGASRAQVGLIRAADGGTLFLDEIAEASPKLQVALLRFLEEGELRPVGGNDVVKVDTRVLAATHDDLEGSVATGRFRADLLHRLNTVSVTVPPLRERPADVPLLARVFAAEAAKDGSGRGALTFAIERELEHRAWPGNVRELRNTVMQLVTLGTLPAASGAPRPAKRAEPVWKDAAEGVPTLGDSEKRTILAALAACDGNKSAAAKTLGISRRGLYYLLDQHGLSGARKA
jgi:transcriptional regulator with GAF, ATPase, and Fis domain